MGARDKTDKWVDILLIIVVIAIITLKIMNIITLSWTWILAPIWICLGLGILFTAFIFIIFFISTLMNIIKENRKDERNKNVRL